jgi:hypothetical protein
MMKKALLPLMLLPLPLLAQVAVQAPSGTVKVNVNAPKIAAFQPNPNELWVVAGGTRQVKIDPSLATRAGWTVEKLNTESGAGVRVVSPQPRNWMVQKQGSGWQVVQAESRSSNSGASYIMLNNGLAGGALVSYPGGPRYRVVPTGSGGISNNAKLVSTLHGVAQALDGTPQTLAQTTQPATPKTSYKPYVQPELQQQAATPQQPTPQPAPVIAAATPTPVEVKPDKAPKPTKAGGRTFDVFPAAKLKAIATPVAEQAAVVEDIFAVEPAAGGDEEATPTIAVGEVYKPGTLVSFTLPAGFRLEDGKLQRTTMPNAPRQLAFARAYGAVADATAKAEQIAATLQTAKPSPTEPAPEPTPPTATLETPTALSQLPVNTASPSAIIEEATLAPMLPATGRNIDYLPGYLRAIAALNEAQRRTGAVLPQAVSESAAVSSTAISATEPVEQAEAPLWYKTPEEVATSPAVVEARRAVADHYLAWQRPTEAIAELSLQPEREPGLPAYPDDRLRLAIAYLATHQPEKAQPLLRMDATLRPDERRIWQAVALQQLGQGAAAVETWPSDDRMVETYPEWLRRLALISRADALLEAGLKSSARATADAAAKEYPEATRPAAWLLRQGMARLGTQDEQAGLELLAQAAANPTDANTAMHAKYEFVKALQRRNELEDKQVSDYLEDLRLYWRGDDLEEKVLADLGDAYLKQGDYRNALARWRTLTRVFPNTPGMPAITEKMTTALLAAFDPESPHQYDPITYLGLYFNFRELLPADARGDRVMERVGTMLAQTTLPERAIPVLEQVLQYRAEEPIDQARLALVLAEAYRLHGKPDLAVRTLDKYKPMAVNTVQQQQWPLAEARALLDLGKPTEAEAALNTPLADTNPAQALELRSEAAWQLENWERLRDLLAPAVARHNPEHLSTHSDQQVMLLRLAYALTQLNQRTALEALLARYTGEWEKVPQLTDSLAALATQVGAANVPGGGRPLAQVTAALGGLNSFTDQFRRRAADIQRQAEEREEYNAKMRFMDLLPPPSL